MDGKRKLAPGRGGILQAALAELGGHPGSNEAAHAEDPAADRRRIQRWAAVKDRVFSAEDFNRHELLGGRTEHDVFQDAADPGYFLKRWKDKPWFPRDYLVRWLLSNLLFGDRADFVGLTYHPESGRMSPVIRQPVYRGDYPSEEAVIAHMHAAGYRQRGRGRYLNEVLGVEVNDAEAHNWIEFRGTLRPIDVIPAVI